MNFLYVHSLPKRPNLKQLKENGIIANAPSGFEQISDEAVQRLMEISGADKRLFVD